LSLFIVDVLRGTTIFCNPIYIKKKQIMAFFTKKVFRCIIIYSRACSGEYTLEAALIRMSLIGCLTTAEVKLADDYKAIKYLFC